MWFHNCMLKKALQKVQKDGVSREIRGLMFGGPRVPTCSDPWPVRVGDTQVGQITSGIWSPRLKANIGLSMIDRGFWDIGQDVQVETPDGHNRSGQIVALPMA